MNLLPPAEHRAASWKVTLALTLVYLSWGTTYLANQIGLRTLPPAVFGGTRIALAGLLLLGWLAWRGELVRVSRRHFLGLWSVSAFLFLAGTGLILIGQKTVRSGVASVLVATTPLWLALLETLRPHGDRLPLRSWLGLVAGLAGVAILWTGKPASLAGNSWGEALVLASALAWAAGSVLHRHLRLPVPPLQTAALQMLLGGGSLILAGLAAGEARKLTPEALTPGAVIAFFYLLVVGSFIGFLAYSWLLNHASAAVAGTYAYVNPVVALLVGCFLGGEVITPAIVAGMLTILAGVALVRTAYRLPSVPEEPGETPAQPERPEQSDIHPAKTTRG
jgi:drug/metabolite transporter (DMT)-like permease